MISGGGASKKSINIDFLVDHAYFHVRARSRPDANAITGLTACSVRGAAAVRRSPGRERDR